MHLRAWYGGILLLSMCGQAMPCAAEPTSAMRAPRAAQSPLRLTPPAERSLPAQSLDVALHFFQQVISPVDGARSTMYPTGSAYARQAIQKHGALLGWLLTVERLMHEGNESQVSPRIRKHSLWRVHDPVEANDWWWHGPDWQYQRRAEPR